MKFLVHDILKKKKISLQLDHLNSECHMTICMQHLNHFSPQGPELNIINSTPLHLCWTRDPIQIETAHQVT